MYTVLNQLRVIATVMVYNEADVIGQLLKHLDRQGIYFVVLDGGSEDGSIEIVQQYRGLRLLEHRIVRRDSFSLKKDLECSLEMARKYHPDWILRNDADEFLESAAGGTLAQEIANEDHRGYNLIQFNNFEFCLTERELNNRENNVRKKLRFYTYSDDFRYRAWKCNPAVSDHNSGGHYPSYPAGIKVKVSPRKFVMRHYRFRSVQGAMDKVFKNRLPRFAPEERARGWHVHYDHFKKDPRFLILDSGKLSRYDEDGRWDLTKRHEWYPNLAFARREELFPE